MPENEFYHGKFNPDFKSKIDIAKDIFDNALKSGIKFSSVGIDSWYATKDFIEYVDKNGKTIYSEIKSNRNIFMFHPVKKKCVFVKPDELVTLVNKHYKHKKRYTKYKHRNGNEVSKWTYSFNAKLKGCNVPFKFVVLFGQWDDKDDKKVHILISNKLNDSSKSVIQNYLMRWGIEQCFKELKDTFYFDQYQVRNIKKIQRYWNICLLAAWTLNLLDKAKRLSA